MFRWIRIIVVERRQGADAPRPSFVDRLERGPSRLKLLAWACMIIAILCGAWLIWDRVDFGELIQWDSSADGSGLIEATIMSKRGEKKLEVSIGSASAKDPILALKGIVVLRHRENGSECSNVTCQDKASGRFPEVGRAAVSIGNFESAGPTILTPHAALSVTLDFEGTMVQAFIRAHRLSDMSTEFRPIRILFEDGSTASFKNE